MKKIIAAIFITLAFFSCKKENEIDTLRCGTVYNQPGWAKNFSTDSLSNISEIVYVLYHSQLPSYQVQDTSYSISVPIRFLTNGSGVLNNNTPFSYQVITTSGNPEIHIFNLNDISSLFPFANTFLIQPGIKVAIEFYQKTGGQIRFTNGVQYPLTTQKYESSYLSFKRN